MKYENVAGLGRCLTEDEEIICIPLTEETKADGSNIDRELEILELVLVRLGFFQCADGSWIKVYRFD